MKTLLLFCLAASSLLAEEIHNDRPACVKLADGTVYFGCFVDQKDTGAWVLVGSDRFWYLNNKIVRIIYSEVKSADGKSAELRMAELETQNLILRKKCEALQEKVQDSQRTAAESRESAAKATAAASTAKAGEERATKIAISALTKRAAVPMDDVLDGYIMSGTTYLGKITTNDYDAKGLLNEFGTHGNKFNSDCIFNDIGEFGSSIGDKSAMNDIATSPPKIYDKDGNFKAYLSVNTSLTPRISPEKLVGWLKSKK